MKFLGMGVPELLIILAVVLLIFGPKHLPKLGSALGSTVKNLRDGLGANQKDEEVAEDEIINMEEDESPIERRPAKRISSAASANNKPRRKASAKKQTDPVEQ